MGDPDADAYRSGFDDGLQAAWDAVNAIIQRGQLVGIAHEWRNGEVLASNAIMALIQRRSAITTTN